MIDILASEDRTALLIHERFKVIATGKTLEQDTVITHRWQDGKIIEYHEFIDTQGMAETMRGTATQTPSCNEGRHE